MDFSRYFYTNPKLYVISGLYKLFENAERHESAYACGIARVRSTEQSGAYTVTARKKLFENAERHAARKAQEFLHRNRIADGTGTESV